MSWNKSTNSRFSSSQGDINVKGMFEGGMDRKRKIWSEEINEPMTSRSELWNVTKKKRSGGGRLRSNNERQDCVGGAPEITLTPDMDAEAGIDKQTRMNSLNLSSKNQTKLLPNAHIEKFLAGNSLSTTGARKSRMNSTLSEAHVHHNTNASRFQAEETNVKKTARKFPDDAGPLYKLLLSALIDENQDFDTLNDEKSDPSRMAEWETDFLGPVPDENLLLKELHLVGIYPEILPGLVEKEDHPHQDKKLRQEAIYPKLASEPPKRPRGRPRTRHLLNPIPEKKETTKEPIPKKKRGRKPKNPQMEKCQEVKESTLEIHETIPKSVTLPTPKINTQELKPASPSPSAEKFITEVDSTKGLVKDMIDFNNDPPEDLSLMLNLDDLDDLLPQNGDDEDISCLDIPMDDISSLNLDFWP